ncbi:hypothetical protein BUALT_Bualt04G0155800 [Buddleja alternifolia]|uniref:WAT1-related protein n=1 Tax=Buddleja alternifolia TaxID=168488 RepID=A0AAV6XXG9_9LAMI|nr:hypothetical protein BUALT_Bualt04G0155800 [Buddleja alternifolia]
MARRRDYCYREVLPFTGMVAAESVTVGLTTIYKAAVVKGLSYHIFMTYSYAISALLILPLAYFFHRKQALPPFTIVVMAKFCLLGVLGNPTLAAALCNLTPATSFILAIIFRMEKLKVRSISGQAKIIGTLVSISGALVAVLYKGPILISTHHYQTLTLPLLHTSSQSNWLFGGALLSASYIILSIWDTTQAKFVNEYPAEFILVFFYNVSSCIVSLPVAIYFAPNLRAWKVPADVQLYSILYSGLIGSGLGTIVRTWGLRIKGPVYVGMFKPLSIAIAAFLGVLFLGDDLSLGSVIGSLIISMGFYAVVFGKRRDDISEISEEDYNVESLSYDVIDAPLLTSYIASIKDDSGSNKNYSTLQK